jgi:anti-sigma factor RsiW
MLDMQNTVHAHEGDLELYIQGRLAPERLSAIDPHLFDCDLCRERLSQSIGSQLRLHLAGKVKADEKHERSEPRFSTGSEAVIQELSPLSLARQKVTIVDISKNGLGILAPEAVLPGTLVQVRFNTTVELAEVRHCSARDDGGYRMGVRFMASSDRNGCS